MRCRFALAVEGAFFGGGVGGGVEDMPLKFLGNASPSGKFFPIGSAILKACWELR